VQFLQVENVTGDVGGEDLPLDTRNWLCFVKIDPVLGRSKVLNTDQVTAAVVLAPATALPSVLTEFYKAMIVSDHSPVHIIFLMLPVDLLHHTVTGASFDVLQAMIRGNTENGFEAAHRGPEPLQRVSILSMRMSAAELVSPSATGLFST
jgi:hypothetical protein